MYRLALLALPLMLAACGGEGANSTITIDGEDGNVSIVTDAEGRTSIRAPGVEGSIKLPRIDIDEADFDVNGIKLYPESKIKDFNLDASDRGGENDQGRLSIAFEAPAALDKVQAWFRDSMARRGFKVSPQGSGFAGTTDKGDPVTLELKADGPDKATGRMTIGA